MTEIEQFDQIDRVCAPLDTAASLLWEAQGSLLLALERLGASPPARPGELSIRQVIEITEHEIGHLVDQIEIIKMELVASPEERKQPQ
jgi:hypothetical protein